ncbi:glycosyltransferase family protein [Arthrobacter sp. NPDC055585]
MIPDSQRKPRLLFFRWAKPGLPGFLNRHLDEHVQTLQHFFEVRVIDRDCDYAAECDAFEPDLCVFESGVYARERSIRNTSSHPQIPKLGFLHSDPYDLARAVFLSDMDRWGVEEFFTTSVAMAEYTPEIADRLFVWPNSVDPAVFHPYPVEKNIPVLFTGSQERHYPWRNAVGRVLSRSFATMTMPHYGWGKAGSRTVFGEEYARLLSASIFVPACGSMSRDLVRKHLEIPAAGACLIAEDTPALAAFGFRDLENCVLGEAEEIAEKLDILLADPGRLEGITAAGTKLVHEAHIQSCRSQVLQWLQLTSVRGPGERIAQAGPAGSLFLAPVQTRPVTFTAGGRDRDFLAAGWQLLQDHDTVRARREFLKCLNYYFIPEAVIGTAWTDLAAGNAGAARDWTTQALVDTFTDRSAPDPDPVLWAAHVRTLLCSGEREQAVAAAARFGQLRHPELDRIRQCLGVPGEGTGPIRASVCPVPARTAERWEAELQQHLSACGQPSHGLQFTAAVHGAAPAGSVPVAGAATAQAPAGNIVRRVRQRMLRRLRWRLRTGAVRQLRIGLSPLKQRLLTDEFSRLLTDVLRREGLESAVLFGQPAGSRLERSLSRGLALNPSLPPLTLLPPDKPQAVPKSLEPSRTAAFVADASAAEDALEFISRCALVILPDTASAAGYRLLSGLSAGSRLVLLAHDPLRGTALLGASGRASGHRGTGRRPVSRAEGSLP